MTIASRWTTIDLEQFPDNPALRYEIIDGELHVSKAPNWYHQIVADRFVSALRAWNDQAALGEAVTTPGVILPDEDNLIPDLIWISNERLALALGSDGKLHMLPEVVIEVLSPGSANQRRDRTDKLLVYGRQGVQEYWIVDPLTHTVEVYRTNTTSLDLALHLDVAETLVSPLLPGFALSLAQVFRGVPRA